MRGIKIIWGFAILGTALFAVGQGALAHGEELWERSLAMVAEKGLQLPAKAHYSSYTLDNTGKSLRSFEADCTLNWDQYQAELRQSTLVKGGSEKKTDGKSKARWQIDVEEWASYLDLALPFFLKDKPELVQAVRETRKIGGVICRGFEFDVMAKGHSLRGTSWIDPQTALPKQVDMRVTNLEHESQDMKVIHFYRTLDFRYDGEQLFVDSMTESVWFIQRSLLKGALFVEEHEVQFSSEK